MVSSLERVPELGKQKSLIIGNKLYVLLSKQGHFKEKNNVNNKPRQPVNPRLYRAEQTIYMLFLAIREKKGKC